jgi:Zn-dependent M28 family amino/carboxypeptidase
VARNRTFSISRAALAAAALAAASLDAFAQITPEQKTAAEVITEAGMLGQIRFLSDDLLEGRAPASHGERIALRYIQSQMEAAGLSPGAPGGGWFQPVPLVGIIGAPPRTIAFRGAGGEVSLENLTDYVAFSGTQEAKSTIADAELVFAGYGIVAPEYGWDDFKNVDVRGKVVVVMNNDPAGDPKLFAGPTRLWYGRWDYKYFQAAKKGAAGCLIIHTRESAGYPWQVVQTSWSRERFELPYAGEPRVVIKGWITEEKAKALAALSGKNLDTLRAAAEKKDFRPVSLGATVSIEITNTIQKKEAANVIGKLAGSDAALSSQAVLYTAHHDHLGKKADGKPGEDLIYNGAKDNATGVSTILQIAEAFAALPTPPKRTIFFASVTAEEQGLLGSEYLAAHPPVPAGAIAANLNFDGAPIYGRTKDLTLIGAGKSNLDAVIARLAAMQGRVIKPDQFPDRGYFYRSDQFNLAKIGVPAAYFDDGTEIVGKPPGWAKQKLEEFESKDYHQPSDELRDDWDLSGAVEDARLGFWLGCVIADQAEMPAWNKGDEFEAARKKALAEAGR